MNPKKVNFYIKITSLGKNKNNWWKMYASKIEDVFDSVSEKIEQVNLEEEKKEKDKKAKKKENLIQEVYTTEKTYIDCLEYLFSVYLKLLTLSILLKGLKRKWKRTKPSPKKSLTSYSNKLSLFLV